MHHEDIKAALRKRGVSQLDLANELEVSPSVITAVISGRSGSRRVSEAISKIVEVPLAVLWPARYAPPAKADLKAILGAGEKQFVDKRRGDRRKVA